MVKQKIVIILVVLVALIGITIWFTSNKIKESISFEQNNFEESENFQELVEILARSENVDSINYSVRIIAPEESFDVQIWQKKEKARMEMNIQGEEVVNLIDGEQKLAYIYMPNYNMANKIEFAQAEEILGSSIKEQAKSVLAYNPEVIGREEFEGKKCLIIEYFIEEDNFKMWIWEEYGLPVKTQALTEQGLIESKVTKIEFVDISDSMFELPLEAEIMDISGF